MTSKPSDFVVHHTSVVNTSTLPTRWMLVLHGILGSGGNFRSITRRVVETCPAWGFLLVDLRGHGKSNDPPDPQTILAAAEDLIALERLQERPIAGVMGHSFGGKVAMAYADRRAGELDQMWILDASPSARHADAGSAMIGTVLRMLEEMPTPLPSRERFFEIVHQHGFDQGVADWLAMNVRRSDDGFRFRLDLRVIRALLEDYFKRDLWPTLEGTRAARELHIVLGGRSFAVSEGDKTRYRELASKSEKSVFVHDLPNAGHWVHADDPTGLISMVEQALQSA